MQDNYDVIEHSKSCRDTLCFHHSTTTAGTFETLQHLQTIIITVVSVVSKIIELGHNTYTMPMCCTQNTDPVSQAKYSHQDTCSPAGYDLVSL